MVVQNDKTKQENDIVRIPCIRNEDGNLKATLDDRWKCGRGTKKSR